jgi:hypothetical protein
VHTPATPDGSLVAGAGQRFESARRLSLFGLDKDPTTGEPVNGATGELVYTAIWRECTPLIRFRMNDIVEVVDDTPCACGRTSI